MSKTTMRVTRSARSIRPAGLAVGLLTGLCLSLVLHARAQQPAPAAPPIPAAPSTRYQISAGDPSKVFVLDRETNVVYLFGTNAQGVWEAGGGFSIPQEIQNFSKRNPIPKVSP